MAQYLNNNGEIVNKHYNEMRPDEKLNTIARSKVFSMGSAINKVKANGDKPFYEKPMSAKEIVDTMPFNALTGKPFTKAEEVHLRLECQANGYKDLRFVTENEAKLIDPNARLKEYVDERTGESRKVDGIVTDKLQTEAYRRNEKGEIVKYQQDVKNKKGEIIHAKGDNMLEKLHEPKVYKIPLYHVSQFENLKLSKDLPKLNKEAVMEQQKDYINSNRQISYKAIDRIEKQGMNSGICNQMKQFMDCRAKGINFGGKEQYQQQDKQQEQEKTQAKAPKKKETAREM
ncbi:DUF1738 domain-containing protein [Helicobacter saguini]|uniref:DUF1738 domain-containing protein n=1 Tax=Helicobacter saguini TaxID=1548018 RepID=A0A099B623_9HELI|nr:ssDNA-binding domain-containing protein [Helicobacter saguini]MWV60996.1 DUF1738 domain-containing protein [Helicobacter saguini]MWV68335.1 DUF1738 domain-containing protein [Helicobacter saguini]MWV70200.1 DUF1738 domain-containing protein [Helicobacter saguini]MWV72103.1 DUF1738 domain-containing protein [Helicobacter saguini]TLD91739.1 DUF1738 domain-containing protein [Helicobacter saguini]